MTILRFVECSEAEGFYHRLGKCVSRITRSRMSQRKAQEVGKLPCPQCLHHPAGCATKGMFGGDCRGCDSWAPLPSALAAAKAKEPRP